MYNGERLNRRKQKKITVIIRLIYIFFSSLYSGRYHQKSVGHMVQENTKRS